MLFEILIAILIIFLSFVIITCFGILIIGIIFDWKELLERRRKK